MRASGFMQIGKCIAITIPVINSNMLGVGIFSLCGMTDSLRILVAEDLPDSVEILKLAFRKAGVNVPIRYVKDGSETIEYLKGEGAFSDRAEHPLPTMLLLDLKMPGVDGFDVLEWLRLQPGLRRLLVVVFTTSEERTDINRSSTWARIHTS